MPEPQYTDEVLVTLTNIDPSPAFAFPERQLRLDRSSSMMEIGRTSKRNPDLRAERDNGWCDSPVMSRNHAQLKFVPDQQKVFIKDRGSLHGTWRNGERVPKLGESELNDGDTLRFGVPIDRGAEKYPPCIMSTKIVYGSEQRTNHFTVPDDSDIEESYNEDDHSIQTSAQRIVCRPWTKTYQRADNEQYPESNVREAGRPVVYVDDFTPSGANKTTECVDLTSESDVDPSDFSPIAVRQNWLQGSVNKSEGVVDLDEEDDESDDGWVPSRSSYSLSPDQAGSDTGSISLDEEEESSVPEPDAVFPEVEHFPSSTILTDVEEVDGGDAPVEPQGSLQMLRESLLPSEVDSDEDDSYNEESDDAEEMDDSEEMEYESDESQSDSSESVEDEDDFNHRTWASNVSVTSQTLAPLLSPVLPVNQVTPLAQPEPFPPPGSVAYERQQQAERVENCMRLSSIVQPMVSPPRSSSSLWEKNPEYFEAREYNKKQFAPGGTGCFSPENDDVAPALESEAARILNELSPDPKSLNSMPECVPTHTAANDTHNDKELPALLMAKSSSMSCVGAPPIYHHPELPSMAEAISACVSQGLRKTDEVVQASLEPDQGEPMDADVPSAEKLPEKIDEQTPAEEPKPQEPKPASSSPSPLVRKRKAADISRSEKEDEKLPIVHANPRGCVRSHSRVRFAPQRKAAETPVAPPSKRLRRFAEVVGYATLGGVAVMSALIATAPTL